MPASQPLTRKFSFISSTKRIYILILAMALFSGSATGYVLASSKAGNTSGGGLVQQAQGPATQANQDNQTFKDFAVGTIQPKPSPKAGKADYSTGAYLLIRENAVPVALTSSVVDLSQYSGKKVKIFGETQNDPSGGWLMDVGRVEVQ
jgi:hypothetical protein